MKKEESIIQDDIRKYLDQEHIFYIRYSAQSSANGIPDLIICYKGYFIGAEVKTSKGQPTLLQEKKLEAINRARGFGILVRSLGDLVDLFNYIDAKIGDPYV